MHIFRFSIFMTTLTLLLGGAHVYLYRRFFRDTSSHPAVHRAGRLFLAFGGGLLVFRMLAAAFGVHLGPKTSGGVALWLGFSLYLFMTTAALRLASRVARLFTRRRTTAAEPAVPASPERRQFLARGIATGAVAAATGVTGYGMWRAYQPPVISEVAVRLPGLPKALDGFKIVQISDIHIGDVLGQRFLGALVQRCNELRPDLMAVTGDLVDGSVGRLGRSVASLAQLRSRFGTYFCTGNHDFYSGDVEWSAALEGMGIHVLRNRFVSIGDAGGSFDLVGVDDWGQRKAPHGRGYNLAKAVQGRDPARASVLLAHQPGSFDETVAQKLGMQLSGHTHGGQLFPNTLLCELIYPVSAGLGQKGGTHIYVNRGAGFWGPPMRVGSPPEILSLTLMAGS